MPRLRFHPFVSTTLLVAVLALFSASTLLAQPMTNPKAKPADTAKTAKTMTWVLTDAKVIDPGKTDGNLTTGYVVEATVTARGQARVSAGKFTILCTIEDQGGGKYQLRGAWDITRTGAPKAVHHTADSIKGTLVANLGFNPAATAGTINAKTFVNPKRRHAGQEVKAKGDFTGDEKFNGTISITRK